LSYSKVTQKLCACKIRPELGERAEEVTRGALKIIARNKWTKHGGGQWSASQRSDDGKDKLSKGEVTDENEKRKKKRKEARYSTWTVSTMRSPGWVEGGRGSR